MADINIPGVTDKYKTNDLIKSLMETERVPLKREQGLLDTYKAEQQTWRNVNAQMATLRESVRSLYSFDNPFNSKIASSTEEYAVTADPKRDAPLQSFKIDVLEIAQADRFLSAELDAKMQVPAGTYEYKVNDKTVSFKWKGGKLNDFVTALNKRSANTVKASLVGITKDTKALLIESLITGSENRLEFLQAAQDLALKTGMIGEAPPSPEDSFSISRETIRTTGALNVKTVEFSSENLSLPSRSGFESPIPQKIKEQKNAAIRFTLRAVESTDEEPLSGGPQLPSSGTVRFKGITLANEELDTKLPADGPPLKREEADDTGAAFVKTANGTEIPLEPIKTNGEDTEYTIKMSDYPDIQSIVIKNNTDTKIFMSMPETLNMPAQSGYVPLHPAATASDAKIKYQGITITRPTNTIEDVVPSTKLNIHAQTDKTATINVEPDKEAAKEALITFVGKYNRLVAEINILTQTEPEIISELEYLSDEEAKAAEERLGMFQTDFSLRNGKRALQNIVINRYATTDDAEVTMLSHIGISSNASSGGAAAVTPSRLRGYLEIDEKKLDTALQTNMPDIKNLFGFDSDGDLIADSGIAVLMDKNLQAFTRVGGIIASKTSVLNTRISSLEKNIESLEKKLTQKERELKVKYGQMEGALNSLEKQADSITNFSNSQKNGNGR